MSFACSIARCRSCRLLRVLSLDPPCSGRGSWRAWGQLRPSVCLREAGSGRPKSSAVSIVVVAAARASGDQRHGAQVLQGGEELADR
jgi:hypothetical protein